MYTLKAFTSSTVRTGEKFLNLFFVLSQIMTQSKMIETNLFF